MPRLRDEVKEECPIVYDDKLSETHYSCLLFCLPPLLCCYISAHQQHLSEPNLLAELRTTLQVFVGIKQGLWAAASVSSIGHYFGMYFRLLEMYIWQYSVTFCTRGHFDQLNVSWFVDNSRPLMPFSQIKLYCYTGQALTRLYCAQVASVAFTSRCVIPSTSCCNCCFTSNVEQHLSVLGPCLMALVLHHTMLGTVYSGLCYIIKDLCPKELAQHHWMLRPAQRGLNSTRWFIFPAIIQQSVFFQTCSFTRCKRHLLLICSLINPVVTR